MSLELTATDLLVLEKQRIERFRSLFADCLKQCLMHLSPTNVLTIHCSQPWIVDQLLSDSDNLRRYGWLIVGADQISVRFAQEEIYRTFTYREGKAQRICIL